jgi:hypothetical protein
MKLEIIKKLQQINAGELKEELIQMVQDGSMGQIAKIAKILKEIETRKITKNSIKIGDVSVSKPYFNRVIKSDEFSKAYEIVDEASKYYPISTVDVIIRAGIKNAKKKTKITVGSILTLAGFKRVSIYRKGETPAKMWIPADKHVEDSLRAEYFFTLLKEHDKLTDTKALDDLI